MPNDIAVLTDYSISTMLWLGEVLLCVHIVELTAKRTCMLAMNASNAIDRRYARQLDDVSEHEFIDSVGRVLNVCVEDVKRSWFALKVHDRLHAFSIHERVRK